MTVTLQISWYPNQFPMHAWMGRSKSTIDSYITLLQDPLHDVDKMETQIVVDMPEPSPSPIHPMQPLNSPTPPPLHRGESTAHLGSISSTIESTAIDDGDVGVEGCIEEGAESDEEQVDDECVEIFQDNETVQILSEDECLMSPQGNLKRQDSIFEPIMGGPTPEPMQQDSQTPYEKTDPVEVPLATSKSEEPPKEDPKEDPKENQHSEVQVSEEVQEEIRSDNEENEKTRQTKGTFKDWTVFFVASTVSALCSCERSSNL